MRSISRFSLLIVSAAFILTLFWTTSCKKDTVTTDRSEFLLVVNNQFNLAQGIYGAFLSRQDGSAVLFRWLKGNDTTHLSIPFSKEDHYDLTLVKLTIVNDGFARDTSVELHTYHKIPNRQTLFLRNQSLTEQIDFRVQFNQLNSLDSLVIPNSRTLIQPQSGTNFFGHFQIEHQGNFWIRAKFNQSPLWKYILFKDISASEMTVNLNQTLLPVATQPPAELDLPFAADWSYQIATQTGNNPEGRLTLAAAQQTPPFTQRIQIYQPEGTPLNDFRLQLQSNTPKQGEDYRLFYDHIFNFLPASIPAPVVASDFSSTTDQRRTTIQSSGPIDNFLIRRKVNSTLHSITWLVTAPVSPDGVTSCELPMPPKALWEWFPELQNPTFAPTVIIRAETYETIGQYEDLLLQLFLDAPAHWRGQNKYTGIEKTF